MVPPQTVRDRGQIQEQLDFIEIPVQKVIQQSERLVFITGEAGAGKTTALRRLAMVMVEAAISTTGDVVLPVFLNASSIANSSDPLVVECANATKRICPGNTPAFNIQDLREGRVAILIDAFDEVTDASHRRRLTTSVSDFRKEYPMCQIILTSRDYPFVREVARDMDALRFGISPINLKQAEKIVDRLSKGKGVATHQTQELLRRLDNVHGMELNPLLVTVFVATTDYARTDIPANITELFKKFTEMMLGRWDQSKGLSQQYQAQVKDFLLCRVAYEMHIERKTSLPLDRVTEIVKEALRERDLIADFDVLFEEIFHRSGLVRVDGEEISFRHLLLQEFFAGRGVPDPRVFADVAGDFWWMRSIVFYFGEQPGDHQGLKQLREGIRSIAGSDRFQAAVAVGLAIQACYLTTVEDRQESLRWVIDTLSDCFEPAIEFFKNGGVGDTLQAVFYYLYGRDAVACSVIKHLSPTNSDEVSLEYPEKNRRDLREFWEIVGLIEARQLCLADERIKSFHPADRRLLLALNIGLYRMENLQVTAPPDRKIAKQIRCRLDASISDLKNDVISEMKGYLLEVRGDQIESVDDIDIST